MNALLHLHKGRAAWAMALGRLSFRPQGCHIGCLRRSISSSSTSLQQVYAEEPTSWRLLPSKGEAFEVEAQVGPHLVTFETGKLARFASGAVLVGIKDTRVLATAVLDGRLDENRSFLPLQVDYREKHYAQGKIPNTFMRREGAAKERELLVSRIIDRSIRPLFPRGFYYDTQIIANVLCSDGEQDPDVMAANAASAALTISDIPWNGPVGIVRIGRVNGQFLVNPDMDELSQSDLNLVYACTMDKTVMIETQAREISNADLKSALYLAHEEASKLISPQLQLASKVQNQKRSLQTFTVSNETFEKIGNIAKEPITTVMEDPSYGKFERGKALGKIQQEVETILKDEGDENNLKILPTAFDQVRKQIVRKNILEKGTRVDGRHLDEVRDIYCEAGLFPPLHGSSLFSRGNTQVLCTVTLGAPEDAQKLESLVGPPLKRFMVHYSFPPFCTNEVGRQGGYLNRREVGHGTLAEKALLALLPPEAEFPYSVRLNSEVMASDGSTSMATVCGGSLALMDAGVPLEDHVAGVSIGLATDLDPTTGKITDYKLLTDILGLEDHIGDMDFKIAGTRKGITAIQLDIKPAGVPLEIICEGLEPAFVARKHILDCMEQEIKESRSDRKKNAPCRGTFAVNRESIRRVIGPQGSNVRNIQKVTGTRLTISQDGIVCIIAKDKASYDQAKDMVDSCTGREIEVGSVYNGSVVAIKDFGAFVELEGGQQGLLHISELSHQKVTRIADMVSIGQQVKVMCIGRDLRGNFKLSMKATLLPPVSERLSNVEGVDGLLPLVSEIEGVDSLASKTNVEAEKSFPDIPRTTMNEEGRTLSIEEVNLETLSTSTVRGTETSSFPSKVQHLNHRDREVVQQQQVDGQTANCKAQSAGKNGKSSQRSMLREDSLDSESCETKSGIREEREADSKLLIEKKVEVGAEYMVYVHETRLFGAVLRMSNGLLGMIRYKRGESQTLVVGAKVHVRCERIDEKRRPVFRLLTS